ALLYCYLTGRHTPSYNLFPYTTLFRSHSGLSGSWPIALTTGVVHLAISRHSVSSENGSRSSTLPPPRAITMTSTSGWASSSRSRSEEHTSELQSRENLVCRLLLEKKN